MKASKCPKPEPGDCPQCGRRQRLTEYHRAGGDDCLRRQLEQVRAKYDMAMAALKEANERIAAEQAKVAEALDWYDGFWMDDDNGQMATPEDDDMVKLGEILSATPEPQGKS